MREQFVGTLKQVLGLLVHGLDFETDNRRTFERELAQLLAPHMAALIDRRQKLLEGAGRERWSDELDHFMRRSLWPSLGAELDYAERNRTFVTLLVDVMIEREQRRTKNANPAVVPLVSRFDASWAN
jgi:hypothetical protein